MENLEFNLNGISKIYNESLERKETTIVFEIKQGRGIFNFLMFFSNDDTESMDILFLFLRRTNTLIKFKLYGNHKKGVFKIYINEIKKTQIINELDLNKNDNTFDFMFFLNNLNNLIPNELSLNNKIKKLREIWPNINKKIPNILNENDKTILFGIIRLPPNNEPQEKTLRKLYIFVNSDENTISELIKLLKLKNITLAWTNDIRKKEKSIIEIIKQVNEK